MKKTFTTLLVCIACTKMISAQTIPSKHLDINNVDALIMNHGDMFYDPATNKAAYQFPKGNQSNSMFNSCIWIAGTDSITNTIKVSAQTYRSNGEDFCSGPLNALGQTDSITSAKWNKLWKINKTAIDSFLSISNHTISNTPSSILDWPAMGNTFALDAYGNALIISTEMAPFVDVNNDGIYNPLMGDYPKIKGEQTIWWVFNDYTPHTASQSSSLNVQIKAMAFACNSMPQLQNVTYYSYEFTNFSNTPFLNTRIGFFSDVDLGYAFDDYIGSDSSRRMAICYNGDSYDEGATGYGNMLTQTGICITKMPNDNINYKAPLGASVSFNSGWSNNGDPTSAMSYYNLMNAKDKIGEHFTSSCTLLDTTKPNVNFVFPDEPNNTSGWSEKSCNNLPGDRRIVISTSDFTFANNGLPHVYEMAIINTPIGSSNADFSTLKSMADYVIAHPNGCSDIALPLATILLDKDLKIFPNPTNDVIKISWSENKINEISLVNMYGEILTTKNTSDKNNEVFNLKKFPNSIYYLQIKSNNEMVSKKISKL